jgi:hypothetical protein
MGLDQYAKIKDQDIDFEKVYSKEYEPTKHGFVWRKHARLQTFMANEFHALNPNSSEPFNGGDQLVMTKDIITRLRKEIDENYHDSFCSGGFFWGHQWQENAVEEYREQDKLFCDWVLTQMEKGNTVIYECSW